MKIFQMEFVDHSGISPILCPELLHNKILFL